MKIKDLPVEIQELLTEELDWQHKNYTPDSKILNVLNAQSTDDGYNFWYNISQGNFEEFYRRYANNINENESMKINLKIELNDIKEVYIDHFIQLVDDTTNGNYFGIRIDGDSIIIEEISYNHSKSISDLILVNARDSYLRYKSIKNVSISPLKVRNEKDS